MKMSQIKSKDRLLLRCCQYRRLGLGNPALDPFDAVARICGACRTRTGARELLALYDTVRYLRLAGKHEALDMFAEVYLSPLSRHPERNEISDRVLRCAAAHHCDARTVYRNLRTVRRVFDKLNEE